MKISELPEERLQPIYMLSDLTDAYSEKLHQCIRSDMSIDDIKYLLDNAIDVILTLQYRLIRDKRV